MSKDPAATPIRVGLFVTCLVDLTRPCVGFAAVKLLEDAGCVVAVPAAQTCCGQPAYNSGDSRDARAIAAQVIEAFEGFDYVVSPSGSCAGTGLADASAGASAGGAVWAVDAPLATAGVPREQAARANTTTSVKIRVTAAPWRSVGGRRSGSLAAVVGIRQIAAFTLRGSCEPSTTDQQLPSNEYRLHRSGSLLNPPANIVGGAPLDPPGDRGRRRCRGQRVATARGASRAASAGGSAGIY